MPKHDDSKKLTCPGHTPIKEVISFADRKVNFEKYIVYSKTKPFEPSEHIEITMPYILSSNEEHKNKENLGYISFPLDMTLGVIHTFFWPLSGLPGTDL